MRGAFAIALLSLIAAGATAAPAPQESWGKPGISFAQYRQDALDCGKQGYLLDISKTEDAKEFVRASRELNSLPMGTFAPGTTTANDRGPSGTNSVEVMARFAGDQQHIIESVRPGERFHHIKKMQISEVQQCLMHRGYSRFRLTDEQRHLLRKLKFGSDERRAYLYSLASNPAVLQGQKLDPQP